RRFVRSSFRASEAALPARADDLPFAAAAGELELDPVQIAVEPAEHALPGAPTGHAGLHDDPCGVRTLERHLGDPGDDLDLLMEQEIAANVVDQLLAIVAARVA